MTKTIHKVERFYPGALFCEPDTITVKSRDPKKYKSRMPKHCDSFRFFDSVEEDLKLENGKIIAHKEPGNYSPTYFPDGEKFTLAMVKKRFPDQENLIYNMTHNDYKVVIRTKSGQFRPVNGDYEII